MVVVLLCSVAIQVSAAPTKEVGVNNFKQEQAIEKLHKVSKDASKDFTVSWNKEKGIPNFITGKLSSTPVKGDAAVASYLDTNKDLFNLNSGNFKVKKAESDKLGMTHYKTDLTVDGITVYGSEVILHTDKDGSVVTINGNVETSVPAKNYKKDVKIDAAKAIEVAKASLDFTADANTFTAEPATDLYIYNAKDVWQVVYMVRLQFVNPYPADMRIFVNATTGKVVDSKNAVKDTAAVGTGIGTLGQTRTLNTDLVSGVYYMRDLTKIGQVLTYTANNTTSIPGTLVTDSNNVFDSTAQRAAVDAHYYTGEVYNYYKNNFNRNSYDANGANMVSTVHYGTNYNNAFWNGSQMVYGDGDGTLLGPVSAAFDVIAHEFTHAVTEYTCNLEYQDQPGAFNESLSDVFGYLIEGQTTDWLMGEDCYTPATPGDAFRSLQDPTLYGDPAHMDDYVVTTDDYGGVHTNSGIPNKAFYLAATTINNNAKMGQIYYRAMTTYLTTTSQFIDARNALVQSATDLYGSTEATAIANAYTAVGIVPFADTYESNGTTATAYGPLTSATTYNSYIASSSDIDYYYFNTAAAGTITINLTNLPKDYDVYLLNSAGTQVAKSENGSTTSETITYSATGAAKFYIKVIGYSGAYSTTTAYALKATYPTSVPTGTWYYETVNYQSAHPYTNNYNGTQTYTKTGAQKVKLHFSSIALESNYDYIYIKDKNGNTVATYTGTYSDIWVEVTGDTAVINLVTDYSVTANGYVVDQAGYYQ